MINLLEIKYQTCTLNVPIYDTFEDEIAKSLRKFFKCINKVSYPKWVNLKEHFNLSCDYYISNQGLVAITGYNQHAAKQKILLEKGGKKNEDTN